MLGSTIRAQYREVKKAPATWAHIVADPTTDREWQLRHKINDKIRRIAAELDTRATSGQMSCTVATPKAGVRISRASRRRTPYVVIPSRKQASEAANEAELIPEPPPTPSSSSRKSAIARLKQRQSVAEQSQILTARKAVVTPSAALPQSILPSPSTTKSTTKIPLVRNNGPVVLLSPEKHANAQQELTPVLPHEAHSPPARLLFRYFDNTTSHLGAKANGVFEGRGFRATGFSLNNCRLPDPPASVCDRLFAGT